MMLLTNSQVTDQAFVLLALTYRYIIEGEGESEVDNDPDAVQPDVIDRILERELQRNYSLEGSPDRLTPKGSPGRRISPVRLTPKGSPGRRISPVRLTPKGSPGRRRSPVRFPKADQGRRNLRSPPKHRYTWPFLTTSIGNL
jgi:hypothetical protein